MFKGARLGGYRLIRQIGDGGMGVVWMAEHAVLGRRAAIKVLRPEYSARPDTLKRFFNEARAATAISDPGITQVFDFGHHTDGSAYLVMELLEGESLARRMHRTGVLPVVGALRLSRQVACTIGAAHARGIIHRDLKPANIFVVRDPEVTGGERAKVLDFGIAKLAHDLGPEINTSISAIVGTPPYMSPEQCRGAGEIDQRSDIYSLGCVLFTLLTGRPPFDTKASGILIMQHMTDRPPRPSALAPNVPAEVDALILRCLAKDPADRFASGAELAQAIDALLTLPSVLGAGPGVATAEPVSSAATTIDAPSEPGASTTRSMNSSPSPLFGTPPAAATSRRRSWPYAAMAVVAVGTIAVVVMAGGTAPSGAPSGPPAPPGPASSAGARPPPVTDAPLPPEAVAALRTLLDTFAFWLTRPASHPPPAMPPSPPRPTPPAVAKPPKPRRTPRAPAPPPGEGMVDLDGDGIPDSRHPAVSAPP